MPDLGGLQGPIPCALGARFKNVDATVPKNAAPKRDLSTAQGHRSTGWKPMRKTCT